MSSSSETNVSLIDAERIAAFLHIAESTDLMLSSPPAVQQKLFAVKCALCHKAELLLRVVKGHGRMAEELCGTKDEEMFRKLERDTQKDYEAYMADVAIVLPWLQREDPALYEAAKHAKRNHALCGCNQREAVEKHEASIQAWIKTIAPSESAATGRRVTRTSTKKRGADAAALDSRL